MPHRLDREQRGAAPSQRRRPGAADGAAIPFTVLKAADRDNSCHDGWNRHIHSPMKPKLAPAGLRKLAAYEKKNYALTSSDMFGSIRGKFLELPGNQKKVAQLVLQEPQWVMRASVGEIAARVDVSAPTIVRFARRIGYDGLRDLKLKLAGALALREPAATPMVRAGDTAHDVIRNVTDGLTTVLTNWRERIDPVDLDQAANAIHRAREIMCIGANVFSNLLAQKLQGELYRLGYNAHSLSDISYQLVATATLAAEDVLIVISLVGQLPALLRAVELAKLRGVLVIAITRDGTALAKMGDIVLRIDVSSNPLKLQGIDASVLQTVTVETLMILVGLKRSPGSQLSDRSHDVGQILSLYSED